MVEVKCEQRSELWYDLRLGRMTASRFSVLMSGESTKGYKDLLSEIAGEICGGKNEEGYQSEDMLRGIELEDDARERYPAEVEESGFVMFDEDDELHEWVGCSPDGWIDKDGILEIKCPKLKTHWGYIQRGVLPNEYKWQVQGQLWVTGRKYCDFMSYYPDMKPFIFRVFPDGVMIEKLERRVLSSIKLIKEEIKIYKEYDYGEAI